jgi:2-polyprenyl-6-methoxyphenol hydroxylase-like FAD-dependent oxidoreductase
LTGGNTALEDSIDLSEALSSKDWYKALNKYEAKMFERGFRNATTSLRSTRMLHTTGWRASLRDVAVRGVGCMMWLQRKMK